MRIVCVAGARPNYMKVKPVMDALEARGAEVVLVHTGQHYDPAMSDVFFTDLGMRKPDHFLGAGSGSHAVQTANVMTAFEPLAEQVRPDVVVVVGDVNSTVACALVAAKSGALLAHVEAGLRSRDWGMPEEVNRVATDRLSDYLFAPSPDAALNLRAEGYREDQIHLVGNVMVDTLLANLDRALAGDFPGRLGLQPGGYGLVTLHRPANVDDPAILATLLAALEEVARACPLVLPAHPRAARRLAEAGISERLRVIPPAGYLDFVALQAKARLVLTDSGGVQEETTALGVPCLTLRENTERPVTLTEGTNQLVGRDPGRIVKTALNVLDSPPARRCPELWDGKAGERIAEVIVTGGRPAAATPDRPFAASFPRCLGMTAADQAPAEIVGICFHGVGAPSADLEAGAAEYFISTKLFLAVLDEVMHHPGIELTFDDGYASDVDIALPALLERGLSARYFPLAGRLGAAGHVGEADVRALAKQGMSIGSHGMNHRSWRGLDAEAATEELATARAALTEAAGEPVTSAAIPFGSYDRGVLSALRRHGYTRVFTSDRRRARPGDWLQPRYSIRRDDTIDTVRQDILAFPSARQRIRGAAAGRLKAWR